MSKDELLEILKKNIPEDFRDDVDDFADYILAVGKDELNTIIEMVLDGKWADTRKRVVKGLAAGDILQDILKRNCMWAIRLQIRAKEKDEFKLWITALAKALLTMGLSKAFE